MKIIVCIKQIPDTNDIKWSKDNNIIRDGVISILNSYDLFSMLHVRTIKDADITILSMGPYSSINSIRYALSYAGNKGVLLSDKKFSGADTLATAKTLAYAIKNYIKEYDLIVTGQFATDGDTAQTPYSLANILNIPIIGYVNKINEINENEIIVTSSKDNGTYKIKGKYPLLISVSKYEEKHYVPLVSDYIRAQDVIIKKLNADDIKANYDEIGIKGSPTYVSKAFRPEHKRECKFIEPDKLFEEIK